jgi:predicted NUDIX family NTP pyrophosphohydrolase
MKKQSAGILMYRFQNHCVEVFLVHPGGPYWRNKDLGSWSIPKGELRTKEDAFETAKREFKEETGFKIDGEFLQLTPIKQTSGKVVHAWAVEADCDASIIKSNTFKIEWPPGSGKEEEFPEVDRAGWFDAETAKKKILKSHAGLIEQLELLIKKE